MTSSLSAPETALLRSAASLSAAGAPYTDVYLIDRAVTARGILLNPLNRTRYRKLFDDLVSWGYLQAIATDEVGGRTLVDITRRGLSLLHDPTPADD